jgi:hypothetical protein
VAHDVFKNAGDRAVVEQAMKACNVHPDEIERVAELGDVPETIGQELVATLTAIQTQGWYTTDLDDPQFVVTNVAHVPAIEMESRVAAGIGRGGVTSQYERLFVGCTVV